MTRDCTDREKKREREKQERERYTKLTTKQYLVLVFLTDKYRAISAGERIEMIAADKIGFRDPRPAEGARLFSQFIL